jgi:hypothetical protein
MGDTYSWNDLDGAVGAKTLFLCPSTIPALEQARVPYEASLQALINDRLDDTGACFGTLANPLARFLEDAFNARGTALTNYLIQQLSQTKDFIKTCHDAAAPQQAADST